MKAGASSGWRTASWKSGPVAAVVILSSSSLLQRSQARDACTVSPSPGAGGQETLICGEGGLSLSASHQPFRIRITGLIKYFSFPCRHEPFALCAPKTFSLSIAFPVDLPPQVSRTPSRSEARGRGLGGRSPGLVRDAGLRALAGVGGGA